MHCPNNEVLHYVLFSSFLIVFTSAEVKEFLELYLHFPLRHHGVVLS